MEACRSGEKSLFRFAVEEEHDMCMRLSMGFEHVHLKKGVCMKGKLTAGRDSVPEPLLEGCCGVSEGTSEGDVVGLMRSGCVCAGSFSCGGWRF